MQYIDWVKPFPEWVGQRGKWRQVLVYVTHRHPLIARRTMG